jgi:hypothetical protein
MKVYYYYRVGYELTNKWRDPSVSPAYNWKCGIFTKKAVI